MSLLRKLRQSIEYAGLGVMLTLSGCDSHITRVEYSPVLHEKAIVRDTIYEAAHTDTLTTPSVSFDSDGDPNISLDTEIINIPGNYAVLFSCKHGGFVVQGADERHENIWKKLRKGERVDVSYRHELEVTYGEKDSKGNRKVLERKFKKYDFIDAVEDTNAPVAEILEMPNY